MLIEITQNLSMFRLKKDGLRLGRKTGSYFFKGKKQKKSSLKFKNKVFKKRTKVLTKYKSSVLFMMDEAHRFLGKNPRMDDFIEQAYRRFRKYERL